MKYVLILDLKILTNSFIFLLKNSVLNTKCTKKCISRFSQVVLIIIDYMASKIVFLNSIFIYHQKENSNNCSNYKHSKTLKEKWYEKISNGGHPNPPRPPILHVLNINPPLIMHLPINSFL